MKKEEWAAIILAGALVLVPLAAGAMQNFGHVSWQDSDSQNGSSHSVDIQAWLTLLVSALTLGVLIFQAYVFHRQRELMGGQLSATTTAANAALAALARPWLFIEGFECNEVQWLSRKDQLIAEFQIANYGNAPAFIKNVQVAHFRGPSLNNGRPPPDLMVLPADVLDFPDPATLGFFRASRGRRPSLRDLPRPAILEDGTHTIIRPLVPLESEFVVRGGKKSDVLHAIGYRKLEKQDSPGLHPLGVTESYLLGWIFYEIPGQRPEIINFCYRKPQGGVFSLFRDYAPYNERKQAL